MLSAREVNKVQIHQVHPKDKSSNVEGWCNLIVATNRYLILSEGHVEIQLLEM